MYGNCFYQRLDVCGSQQMVLLISINAYQLYLRSKIISRKVLPNIFLTVIMDVEAQMAVYNLSGYRLVF